MKKVLFAIIAICSFGIISCEKNIEPIAPQENDSKLVKMTFSASTPATKTAIGTLSEGQYPVTWSEGDQIRVIAVAADGARMENENEVFDIDPASVGLETASFTGTSVEGAAAYYAVYPASLDATINGTGDNATVSLSGFASHSVEAVAGGFDPSRAVMFAAADGSSFAFKHGMIYFKLTISAADVTSVELSCTTSDTRIYGNPKYKFSDGSIDDSIGDASQNKNYITLNGSLTEGGTYYIPVIAKNRKFGALTLTYTNSAGYTVAKKTTKLSTEYPVNGTVYDLGTPPVAFVPSLKLLKSSVINIPYSAAEGLVIENAYKLSCCTDDDVTVTCDGTIITEASAANGTITYNISANDGDEERTGNIYLKLGDDEPLSISITQLYEGGAVIVKEHHLWDFSSMDLATITGLSANTNASAGTTWDFGDGLTMVTNGNSKWNTQTISGTSYQWVATGGKYGSNQKYFAFSTESTGTVTVLYASGGSASRSLSINVKGSVTTDSANVSSGTSDLKTVTFSTSASGTIMLYSTVDNIRIFRIEYQED